MAVEGGPKRPGSHAGGDTPSRAAQAQADDLLVGLRHAGVSLFRQDKSLAYLWSVNPPENWPAGFAIGRGDDAVFAPEEADRLSELKRLVIRTGKSVRTEIIIDGAGVARSFEATLDPAGDGVLSTLVESTEGKRQEQTVRSLLREVSHRSKNLLAIVLSIATQTARHAGSVDEFLVRFHGRVQSLAMSQDLITSSNWRGTRLHDLIEAQVMRLFPDRRDILALAGVNPWLDPNATLHIGLGLHELAVNSGRFGALASRNGRVSLSAELMPGTNGPPHLVFEWKESAPIDGTPVLAKRFGSTTLERVVPASLGGKAEMALHEGRLSYRLVIPPGHFALS